MAQIMSDCCQEINILHCTSLECTHTRNQYIYSSSCLTTNCANGLIVHVLSEELL